MQKSEYLELLGFIAESIKTFDECDDHFLTLVKLFDIVKNIRPCYDNNA